MAQFQAGQILTADALNSVVLELERQLDHQEVETAGTGINFTNISQDYRHLMIKFEGATASTVSSRVLQMNFPGLTNLWTFGMQENHYDGAAPVLDTGTDAPDANIARIEQFFLTSVEIMVFNYRFGSTMTVRSIFGWMGGNVPTDGWWGRADAINQSGDPVTDIRLFGFNENLDVGASATLYGLR